MSQGRVGQGFAGRDAIRGRLGNCETVENLVSIVRDMTNSIPFRNEVADGAGKTKITLDSNLPQSGSDIVCRTKLVPGISGTADPTTAPNPSTNASGTVSQDIPHANPTPENRMAPVVHMSIRGFNNFDFDPSTSTLLSSATYAPKNPQQELLVTVDLGGKQLHGRIPLMDNHNEGVPKPLLGWTGTAATAWNAAPTTVADVQGNATALMNRVEALQEMHNDLVQSILKFGLLRPVERGEAAGSDLLTYPSPPA